MTSQFSGLIGNKTFHWNYTILPYSVNLNECSRGRDVPNWADIPNIADLGIKVMHERNAHFHLAGIIWNPPNMLQNHKSLADHRIVQICGIFEKSRDSAKYHKIEKIWQIHKFGQNHENDKFPEYYDFSIICSWEQLNIGDLLEVVGGFIWAKAVDYRAPWAHIIKLAPAQMIVPRARMCSSFLVSLRALGLRPQPEARKRFVLRTIAEA